MKTKKIDDGSDDRIFAHTPANNDEYHVLIAALESCGLEKIPTDLSDEAWQAVRFNPDGTWCLEFHSVWFDDMELEV